MTLKIVNDNHTESLQYSMEDSEFTRYAAKMLANRKSFYDKNPDATNPKFEQVGNELIPPMVRRPTLRKGQEPYVHQDGIGRSESPGHPGYAGDSPRQPNRPGLHPDSSQSLESVPDYRHPPDYHDHRPNLGTDYHDMPRNQHHNIAQRQTASFRYLNKNES